MFFSTSHPFGASPHALLRPLQPTVSPFPPTSPQVRLFEPHLSSCSWQVDDFPYIAISHCCDALPTIESLRVLRLRRCVELSPFLPFVRSVSGPQPFLFVSYLFVGPSSNIFFLCSLDSTPILHSHLMFLLISLVTLPPLFRLPAMLLPQLYPLNKFPPSRVPHACGAPFCFL